MKKLTSIRYMQSRDGSRNWDWASPPAVVEVPESDEVIKLVVNEWTTQQVITQIAEQLLEEMSYNVESVTVGYYPQIEAMIQNDVTATLELWPTNIGEGT